MDRRTDGSTPPFRLTRTRTGETAPQLSPDATRIAYARDGQVFVQDLSQRSTFAGHGNRTGEGGGLGAFRWSPDGTRLLYTVRVGTGAACCCPTSPAAS